MKKRSVVLVLAVLAIVAGANGEVLERHDFGAAAPAGWANSGTSTWAATPYGTAALSEDVLLPSRGLVAKLNSTSWLQVGADPVLAGITDKLMIDVWVYNTSTSTAMQRIVGRAYDWYIDQASTTKFASFTFRDARASATPIVLTGSAVLNNSLWHHIIAWYDAAAGTASLNVDGTIVTGTYTSGGTVSQTSTARYAIGARATSDTLATNMFRGSVDDVRISNIPEPITIVLLGLGSMLVRRFRRIS
jgi:hypothetical protein